MTDSVAFEAAPSEDIEEEAPPEELLARRVPTISTEDVPLCPVCQASTYRAFARGFDYELLTCANSWRFVGCETCEHVWLNPRPAISALPLIYPPTYYAYDYEKKINPIAVRGKELLDKFKVDGILRHLLAPARRYLDIGCGSGRFLKVMETKGLSRENLYGLELDKACADRLSAQGYKVSSSRVEQSQDIPSEQLDLITMFHVIEHVDDPAAVVRKVTEWLAPGGVFAVETPNRDSYDARRFKNGLWGGYHIPRHWHIFTPGSLTRLLESAGLEVISTKYQPGHSFWMYSVHHTLRYGKPPRPRLAGWFDPFQGFLPFLILFTCWDKLRAIFGYRTSAMLMLARKPIR
ncbi:MAG: class I SAM-dependent methyltransferase [Pseudomonadota bacterium]